LTPVRALGEDSAWLLEEWTRESPQVAPLRVVESVEHGMPEDLPASWDEGASLAESFLDQEPPAPARRDEEGFTSPEDFFLRPEGQ